MANFDSVVSHLGSTVRRLLLAGGFALAVAAVPALSAVTASSVAPASHLADCTAGEEADSYSSSCVPHTAPDSPQFSTPAGNPDIPEIDGIPCTGRNSGECIGLQENAPDFVPPTSSVGSEPTIHGEE